MTPAPNPAAEGRPASEPAAYGIGSDHWPGIGKSAEEMSELGVVIGKLFGSGGNRNHWSGDLVQMMRDEIADVRAALSFLETSNPVLGESEGHGYMLRREAWKLALFWSWHRDEPEDQWPTPEAYNLPPRPRSVTDDR